MQSTLPLYELHKLELGSKIMNSLGSSSWRGKNMNFSHPMSCQKERRQEMNALTFELKIVEWELLGSKFEPRSSHFRTSNPSQGRKNTFFQKKEKIK